MLHMENADKATTSTEQPASPAGAMPWGWVVPESMLKGKVSAVTAEKANALDIQEGGSHYKDMPIQPVEFIHLNGLDFLQGNVVKYIVRHDKKNGAADVRKAIHYCQLILQLQYGETP